MLTIWPLIIYLIFLSKRHAVLSKLTLMNYDSSCFISINESEFSFVSTIFLTDDGKLTF